MKIYVQKYQSGGGLPPLIDYTVVPPVSSRNAYYEDDEDSSSKSKSSSKDSDDLGIKDIFNLLKDLKGLPSDVNEIQYLIQDLLSPQTSMFGSAASTASQYANLLGTINRIKFSSEAFDNEKKRITDHTDGLNSIAVDGAGNVLVRTKNGEALMSPEEALQAINKGLAMPITNKDLLLNRAYNDAFDDTVYSITANAIGPKDIQERIDEYIKNLGSIENLFGGYSRVENNKVVEGIGILEKLSKEELEAVKVGGLFKIDTLTKDQKANAMLALDYIWRSLPTNAKTYLKFISGGTELRAKLSVLEFITSKTQSIFKWDTTLTKDVEGNITTGNGSSSSLSDIKTDLYTSILKGEGTNKTFTLMGINGDTMQLTGKGFPYLTDAKGNKVSQAILFDLLQDGWYGMYDSSYSITFGNQPLTVEDLQSIIFKNDGLNTRIILPVKIDDTGKKVPDLDFVEEHKEAIELLNTKGFNDPEVKKALANTEYFDSFGNIRKDMWKPYLAINVYGIDLNITSYKRNIPRDIVKNNLEDRFNSIFKASVYSRDELSRRDKRNVSEGIVYIPLTSYTLQSMIALGQTPKEDSAVDIDNRYYRSAAGEISANVLKE